MTYFPNWDWHEVQKIKIFRYTMQWDHISLSKCDITVSCQVKQYLPEIMINYEWKTSVHVHVWEEIITVQIWSLKKVCWIKHYLHNSCMACEDCFCINDAIFFWSSINVPQTNSMIIWSTEQIAIQIWIPRQTIAFFLMTSKPEKIYRNK